MNGGGAHDLEHTPVVGESRGAAIGEIGKQVLVGLPADVLENYAWFGRV